MGAAPTDLGRSLAYAAALRVVHFGTANEHSDWETAHDVFSLAYGYHRDRRPTHGYAATREDAMAAFAKSWRRE